MAPPTSTVAGASHICSRLNSKINIVSFSICKIELDLKSQSIIDDNNALKTMFSCLIEQGGQARFDCGPHQNHVCPQRVGCGRKYQTMFKEVLKYE